MHRPPVHRAPAHPTPHRLARPNGPRHPRRSRRAAGPLCALGVLGALLAGAGSSGAAAVLGAPAAAAAPESTGRAQCRPSSLTKHKGTVHIDFWESMVTANGKTLSTLTDAFNASQKKVHVTLVQQRSYTT
ncbi:MAG TPA: hypothetical protein VMD28_05770, partial [Acidimicrobiales bacterium]|nr:hypothetical protein [Acidimicrobiales bacterium]